MAIIKTVFSGTSQAANAAEVAAWLQENATDFFSSVSNTNNVITCEVIGGGSLIISPANSASGATNKITLANGANQNLNMTGGSRFTAAYKTSKGIMLTVVSGGFYILCKSNEDTIGIVAGKSSTLTIHFADFVKSTAVASTTPNGWANIQAELTSLAACPLGDSGTYADGLWAVYACQYTSNGVLELDGTKYAYNRYFALEE